MTKIDFYSFLVSAPCRSVYMFMKANDIAFEYHNIVLPKDEQKSDAYLKINPQGTVPAIKDGDFCLGESVAILQYLAMKFSVPDHWYPSDIKKRAAVDEYLSWHHSNTRRGAGLLFYFVAIVSKIRKEPRDEKKIEEVKTTLRNSLDMLDNYFLKGKQFIAGDEISIADLLAICELNQVGVVGLDVCKDRPNMEAWRERIKAKLGSCYDEPRKDLMNFTKIVDAVEPF